MERLTAQDRISLVADELGWSLDIGAVAVLDGTRLLDADDRLDINAVRESIGGRPAVAPQAAASLWNSRAPS